MKLKAFLEYQLSLYDKKFNLIIHGGTPKTGTTSLQFFLKNNSELLKERGFIYSAYSLSTYDPKHQWLINGALNADEDIIIENFKAIFSDVDINTHTIILSAEGIYNHWHDFPLEGKNFIRLFKVFFNLNIFIWFREPVSYAESLYVQMLKNPKMDLVKCYGQSISLRDMLNDNWFRNHFNYKGFIEEINELLDESTLIVFKYEQGNTIEKFCNYLKIDLPYNNQIDENNRLKKISVKILRFTNRYNINNEKKNKLISRLKEFETFLSFYSKKYESSQKDKKYILKLFAPQREFLETKYNLKFKDYEK